MNKNIVKNEDQDLTTWAKDEYKIKNKESAGAVANNKILESLTMEKLNAIPDSPAPDTSAIEYLEEREDESGRKVKVKTSTIKRVSQTFHSYKCFYCPPEEAMKSSSVEPARGYVTFHYLAPFGLEVPGDSKIELPGTQVHGRPLKDITNHKTFFMCQKCVEEGKPAHFHAYESLQTQLDYPEDWSDLNGKMRRKKSKQPPNDGPVGACGGGCG